MFNFNFSNKKTQKLVAIVIAGLLALTMIIGLLAG